MVLVIEKPWLAWQMFKPVTEVGDCYVSTGSLPGTGMDPVLKYTVQEERVCTLELLSSGNTTHSLAIK